ncbi:MAG: polysaccharide biosynthesis tyrosine autokinase [Hahellaceae bacterium]|nr:polysaccharide biosynthesis tyrosine autokinase [Hahellaceae bacterium]
MPASNNLQPDLQQENVAATDSEPQRKEGIVPDATHDEAEDEQITINLNLKALADKGFITKFCENRGLIEQYRAIKRKLLNNAFGPISSSLNRPNLIIVSSSNSGEGKTFTSINLAMSFALEQDKTVLLVDSDVLRPSVSARLGIDQHPGLIEFLSGEISSASSIIHSTNIDKLKFIAAGKPHHLSTELLASERMSSLVEELATRYSDRIVIFDAPPLLGINETHILANLVGQAVVVVEEGKTKADDVKAAVAQLKPELAIGYVMNKTSRSWGGQYGYYYSK